ncbi:MAG: hypothetical protein ACE5RJ_00470 [Nitrosopumilaceae archaeon]
MSLIEAVSDVDNTFLSRREITCNFMGLGGKLKKLEAVDMISKEFKLDGKVIIPISMKNHSGKPLITGTFYIYDDENLAKTHVNPVIFSRFEKAKSAGEKKETETESTEDDAPAAEAASGEEVKEVEAPAAEAKSEEKAEESKPEEKSE